ncbi:MAG: NADH-quinone oxidoreductase subunit A [Candidatus Micrarchaeia archaeon]
MLYNYIAIAFFVIFALAFPLGMLYSAKLIARRERPNPIKNAPYESGEETIGRGRDFIEEYMPFYLAFLPFEIVVIIAILWSGVARTLSYIKSIEVLGLFVLATLFAMLAYRLASDKNE